MNDATQTETSEGKLGLFDAVSIIVGIVVGASIFRVPGLIFLFVSDPWSGLAVWLFGGLLALVGGLSYAELATTYPRSGGDYEYLTRAYGPAAGFLFGWAQLTLILSASIGVMAIVFADYAIGFVNSFADEFNLQSLRPEANYWFASLAVLALTGMNLLGVTMGKWTQNVLTATKVLGLGLIFIAGFVWAQPDKWSPPPGQTTGFSIGALAIILVLYAYGGWNDAAFVAAEVRNRRRNIPLALILGISIITVIYLLVNSAYILGLGWEGVRMPTPLVPVKLVERTPMREAGARAISALIMISGLGAANGLIFTGSRVYATVGEDHRLFGFLGGWKPGRGAPVVALVVQAGITLVLITMLGTKFGHDAIDVGLGYIGQLKLFQIAPSRQWNAYSAFDTLVSHTAPVFWFFFLLTGVSVIVLRIRDPQRERPFRVPLFPVLPFIFCGMCGYMLYRSVIYVEWRALFAVAMLALGIPLFAISWLMKKP